MLVDVGGHAGVSRFWLKERPVNRTLVKGNKGAGSEAAIAGVPFTLHDSSSGRAAYVAKYRRRTYPTGYFEYRTSNDPSNIFGRCSKGMSLAVMKITPVATVPPERKIWYASELVG